MSEFQSLEKFGQYLLDVAHREYRREAIANLEALGSAVSKDATASIGIYQQAIGPFPAWAPLAASTLARKRRYGQGKGGDPNTPLFATGKFEKSVGYKVNKSNLSVTIGSSKKEAVNTELGTSRQPPRPVFGPAALRTVPQFLPIFAASAAGKVANATPLIVPFARGRRS